MKIVYYGPLSDFSGYAGASRGYVKGLMSNGADISTVHLKIDHLERHLNEEEERVRLNTLYKLNDVQELFSKDESDVLIFHATPELYPQLKDRFMVSVMSWETDRIPARWVNALNKLSLCIVSCEDNAKAYRMSGVKIPIEVVPLACDPDVYKKDYQPIDIPELDQFKFKFYSIFQMYRKKGLDVLLKAYFSEFTGNEDVLLVLKTYLNMKSDVDEMPQIQRAVNTIRDNLRLAHYPRVLIVNERYSDEEIMQLHNSCDAYVLPSRAEGWSITHFDALCMGKYPIAVGWGGPTEFIDNGQNGRLVDFEMQPVFAMQHPVPDMFTGHENWAEPSLADLKKAMGESYNYFTNSEGEKFVDYQKVLGQKTAETFSYKEVGKQFKDVIEKYYQEWLEKK